MNFSLIPQTGDQKNKRNEVFGLKVNFDKIQRMKNGYVANQED